MKYLPITALLGLAGFVADPAFADKTDVLYQNQSWMVEGVTFDDGTYACLAEVTDPGESFSIWIFPDKSIRLQFYSSDWDMTAGDTANLQAEIDHRSPWVIPDAQLTQHSALYDLPNSNESVNFVVEVAKGSTLHLRTEKGEFLRDYSLAGSSASIQYLVDCGNAITGDRNPFN